MTDNTYALVFSPHPDDAEIGAGGTIVRWAREGKAVVLVTCTNGDKGTNDPNIKPEDLVALREVEQNAAAKLLMVKETIRLSHPDQTLEDTPALKEEVTRLIRIYKPEVVLTTDFQRRYRSHPDHRAIGRTVMDAVSLYARNLYAFPDLYFKEGLELHEVPEVLFWGSDAPNCCYDITDTYDIKNEARSCHKSQFGEINPERESRMRERYRAQAEQEDFELGEAFHRVDMRMPPITPREKS